jgi:hypothetical protein
LKRWIALALVIGIAATAGYAELRRRASRESEAPHESISAASRAQLDDVIQKSGAGDRR